MYPILYVVLLCVLCPQDYLEAKEEFDRLPQQWKSNIRKHGHVHQYHTIVIDCSPMLFVDAAGVEVLLKVSGTRSSCACMCVWCH